MSNPNDERDFGGLQSEGKRHLSHEAITNNIFGNIQNLDVRKLDQTVSLFPNGNFNSEYLDDGSGNVRLLDKLGYRVGIAYGLGIGLGGLYGAVQGIRTAPSGGSKLLINSMLNQMGRRGSRFGNTLAVIALIYSSTSGVDYFFRKNEDNAGVVGCGAVTGLVYAMLGGPKKAAIGLAAGGVSAGVYVFLKESGLLEEAADRILG